MDGFGAILWIVFLLLGYLFPTLVAFGRENPNKAAIFTLNLLLGWSMLGWVIALVWAMKAYPKGVYGDKQSS